jgi:hypothetical protein
MSVNLKFHATCRKFQHCPLLSLTALYKEKRVFLVLTNEGIHPSSAQEQETNLGRKKNPLSYNSSFC